MLQQISKKIFIYLFIFLLLGTLNNKNFLEFRLQKKSFEIIDKSQYKNEQLNKDLTKLINKNLFFLKKEEVLKAFESNQVLESFFVFKKYPSYLIVKTKKTDFLAVTKKDGFNFFIGSNGNFIKVNNEKVELPFIFGDIKILEFLKLKKIIDNSNFDYNQIKNLYYFKSKRWDIETKDGLIISLPSEKLERSFEILSKISEDENLNKFNHIDLRQNNQIILN